ncbi:MAG: hypothetical protein HC876_19705, partial [Chloroflexaceae bacterium]|nr:hypothetical protein [Chloroflexaceae bacterium]
MNSSQHTSKRRKSLRWTAWELLIVGLSFLMIFFPVYAEVGYWVNPPVAPAQERATDVPEPEAPEAPAEPERATDAPQPEATEAPADPAPTAAPEQPAPTEAPPATPEPAVDPDPVSTTAPEPDTAAEPAPTSLPATDEPDDTEPQQRVTETTEPVVTGSPTQDTGTTGTPSPTLEPGVTETPIVVPPTSTSTPEFTSINVNKIATVPEAAPGETFSYRISIITADDERTVTNFQDVIDSNLRVISVSPGVCSVSGQTVSCGSLTTSVFDPVVVSIQVEVRGSAVLGSVISNQASVEDATDGTVTSNVVRVNVRGVPITPGTATPSRTPTSTSAIEPTPTSTFTPNPQTPTPTPTNTSQVQATSTSTSTSAPGATSTSTNQPGVTSTSTNTSQPGGPPTPANPVAPPTPANPVAPPTPANPVGPTNHQPTGWA